MKQSTTKIISILSLAALSLGIAAQASADFNPSELIKDSQFSDTATFGGASGVQQFLATKGSILANTDPAFLVNLKEPSDSKVKAGLNDPEPNLGRLRTAAELIWDASQSTGLNPQVIVVILQKEQSLITGTFSTPAAAQKALDHALGFNCTDSAGCSQMFSGFYFQLFGNFDAQGNRYIGAAASLMRSFNTPNGRGPAVDANGTTFGGPAVRVSHVGDGIMLDNTQGPPNNAAPNQLVTLSNLATAALYRYTPHVYNGNYNFWKFFSSWFKYANGTLLHLAGDANVYIISNGSKSLLANFVMLSRGLNPQTTSVLSVSQDELSSYDTAAPYPPPDNTIVNITGDTSHRNYVFEDGTKHPLSFFVLQQRGLNPNNALTISQTESDLFPTGALLAPTDGTLVQGNASKIVYVILGGQKMALTAFTVQQYGYKFKNVHVLPQEEVDAYATGGFLLPKEGTLLKFSDSQQVYLLQDQQLHPISATVFRLQGYSLKSIAVLDKGELANAPLGNFVAPPDGNYVMLSPAAAGAPVQYYWWKNGTLHSISDFVAKQRSVKQFADPLTAGEIADLTPGSPLPPTNGTLIQGDASPAIYAIVTGQKVILDYNTWVKKYGKRKPTVLPQAEVDSYTAPASQTASNLGAGQIQQ